MVRRYFYFWRTLISLLSSLFILIFLLNQKLISQTLEKVFINNFQLFLSFWRSSFSYLTSDFFKQTFFYNTFLVLIIIISLLFVYIIMLLLNDLVLKFILVRIFTLFSLAFALNFLFSNRRGVFWNFVILHLLFIALPAGRIAIIGIGGFLNWIYRLWCWSCIWLFLPIHAWNPFLNFLKHSLTQIHLTL